MNMSKLLIICWSFIWGICLISLGVADMNYKLSLIGHLHLIEDFEVANLFYIVPLYAFIIWLMGCVLLVLICRLLRRWIDPPN